jgi:Outer membrane protein beta-barrel domain
MNSFWRATLAVVLLVNACPVFLNAQDDYDENSKINTNIAIGFGVPLNPIARFANWGYGITVGAGYNVSRRNAFIGEFMWHRLYPSDETLAPLRLAVNSRDLNGHSDIIAITGNYRYELRGRSLGTYFIGGGGFYHRNTELNQEVVTGTATVCTPIWLFWGFACSSGVVSSDQTLASRSSGTWGVNGGMGFTVKVGEPRYRLYLEARYHYAPTTPLNTQFIPITFGIRF